MEKMKEKVDAALAELMKLTVNGPAVMVLARAMGLMGEVSREMGERMKDEH